jgi:ribosomal protein S18 acetylase RimI-like enzyme
LRQYTIVPYTMSGNTAADAAHHGDTVDLVANRRYICTMLARPGQKIRSESSGKHGHCNPHCPSCTWYESMSDAVVVPNKDMKALEVRILDAIERIERKHWPKGQSWAGEVKRVISKPNIRVYLILDSNGLDLIGYCVCLVPMDVSQGQLSKVWIDSTCRHQGLGTQLVSTALAHIKDLVQGCKKSYTMSLFVETRNQSAIGLYTKLGFGDSQLITQYYGDESDAFRMSLNLL